jgi:hypothetical protein
MEVTVCVCVCVCVCERVSEWVSERERERERDSLVYVITFKFTDDDYETTKYFEHSDINNDV